MPRVVPVDDLVNVDPRDLREAVRLLRDGWVVAFPTDTLYGLAVDPRNAVAVRRLYELKGRAETSALTLIAADVSQAEQCAVLNRIARALADAWWPGPLTIVAPATSAVAPAVLAGGTTVGVRVPNHAIARALVRTFDFCVTATSANRSGEPPAVTATDVLAALPDVDCVIDGGPTPGGAPSTMVEAREEGPRLLREGAITWDRVIRSLG
jgi:L-threonylcarbamoyladenylate synthase